MTGRRRLAGVLGIGAVALGAAVLLHPPWVSADQGRPSVFTGTASAAALHEEDNGQAGFAVYEPVYGSFAEGATSYTNDGQKSRASTVYPGPTFGNTGGLVCQLSCEPVPAYPLSVETDGPPTQPPTVTQQTSTNVGGAGQPASATAAEATASADPKLGVSSEAVDGAFSSPGAGPSAPAPAPAPAPAASSAAGAPPLASGGSPSSPGRILAASQWFHHQASLILQRPAAASSSAIVTVRSMTASTTQRFVGSALQSDATTELSGVSLLGGMIDIGSIVTTSHATGDGAAVHDQKNDVTVSGVTVAGVPATIGSGGITVSGQGTGSGGLDALNSALQQALAAAGADVTLVGVTAKPPQPLSGCGGSQADGVFLHTATNVQDVPLAGDIYNGDYTLGSSCASVTAANPGGALPGAGGTLPGAPATGGLAPASTGSGAAAPGSAGLAASYSPASGAAPASGGSSAPSAAGSRPSGAAGPTLAGQLVSRRFTTLYLFVVLALTALLVGAGVRPPRARLRGAGPRSRP